VKIRQLKITVYLKQDIKVEEIYKYLSNYINGVMKSNDFLSAIHISNKRYKFYSYSGLMPTPKDKTIYKKDNLYCFELTTPDIKMLENFKSAFKEYNDSVFINCSTTEKNFTYSGTIKKIITVTPCVITYNNRSLSEKRMALIRERVLVNLIRKYNAFFNKNISEEFDFIEDLSMHNKSPIPIRYKNTTILGFKLNLQIRQDDLSQELAMFALQTGILEKNSLGLGYCKIVW